MGQSDRAQVALEAQDDLVIEPTLGADCFDERGQALGLPQELQARPRAGLDL